MAGTSVGQRNGRSCPGDPAGSVVLDAVSPFFGIIDTYVQHAGEIAHVHDVLQHDDAPQGAF